MLDIIGHVDKNHRTGLAAIIVVALLAFGMQIPWLGFFQDDWNFVFYSSVHGIQGLFEFLIKDGRPGGTWVYALGFALLGYKPALWQFFSLLLRVLTTISFWMILNHVWPKRLYGNIIASIIFLTYPFFTLQPQSVAYSLHWMAYLLYALSVFFMIQALQKPGRYLLFSVLAVLSTFAHLLTSEYFVGLELLRPLILWFLFSRGEKRPFRKSVQKVLITWLPYALILVFFVAWRSFVLAKVAAQNDPLAAIFNAQVILSVARNIFADWVLMFVSSWFNLIDPARFVIGPIRNLYLFVAILIGAGSFYFLLRPLRPEESEEHDLRGVLVAGILIFATGMISAYSIGYVVHLKTAPWNSRFALPAMAGLAMMSSSLIEALATSPKTRHLFLAVLVGLLIGWQNQNTLKFKSAWDKQSNLYEQFVWRAPTILPGTPIIANEEIVGYMGDYPMGLALNTIYGTNRFKNVPVWFFAYSVNYDSGLNQSNNMDELAAHKSTTTFRGQKRDAIIITYQPENKQCLWVLRPQDSDYKDLPVRIKEALQSLNYGRIQPEETDHTLYHEIISENKDSWCYFYQKADLARQQGDWNQVLNLWNKAQSQGYRPDSGFEYIPFIEAYAHAGQWEDAFLLTKNANKATKAMYFILCPTWRRLAADTPVTEEKSSFVEKANNFLNCSQ